MISTDQQRVLQGGTYDYDAWGMRPTDRSWDVPVDRDVGYGFRIVVRRKP